MMNQMKNLGQAPSFADVDTDGDGNLSVTEFVDHQANHRR
jgi:hypothetical protein